MFNIREIELDKDINDIVQCFIDSFFETNKNENLECFIKDILKNILELGDFTLVAEKDSEVCGYIIGEYYKDKKSKMKKNLRFTIHWLSIFYKYKFDKYKLSTDEKRQINLLIKKIKSFKSFTIADAEILNMSSKKIYRNSVDKALVDAFVNKVKEDNYSTIKVLADSILTFNFYENYGFKLTEEYDIKINELDNKVKVYIYNLYKSGDLNLVNTFITEKTIIEK